MGVLSQEGTCPRVEAWRAALACDAKKIIVSCARAVHAPVEGRRAVGSTGAAGVVGCRGRRPSSPAAAASSPCRHFAASTRTPATKARLPIHTRSSGFPFPFSFLPSVSNPKKGQGTTPPETTKGKPPAPRRACLPTTHTPLSKTLYHRHRSFPPLSLDLHLVLAQAVFTLCYGCGWWWKVSLPIASPGTTRS